MLKPDSFRDFPLFTPAVFTVVLLVASVTFTWADVACVGVPVQCKLAATFTFTPKAYNELIGKTLTWSIQITSITKNGVPCGEYTSSQTKSAATKKPHAQRAQNDIKETAVFNYDFTFNEPGTWVVEYKIRVMDGANICNEESGQLTFEVTQWASIGGFLVPPGWTQNPDGSITTPSSSNEQGPSMISAEPYPNGFDMSFEFTFPQNPQPVLPGNRTDEKPSFYPNSGIYIYGTTEIQIIDTNAIIAAGYYETDGTVYGEGGQSTGELTIGCLSGIPYNYDALKGMPLQSNLAQPGQPNTMTISVWTNTLGQNVITVSLNSIVTYEGMLPNGTGSMAQVTPNDYIYIQSHWGSMVTYSNISISPRQ